MRHIYEKWHYLQTFLSPFSFFSITTFNRFARHRRRRKANRVRTDLYQRTLKYGAVFAKMIFIIRRSRERVYVLDVKKKKVPDAA